MLGIESGDVVHLSFYVLLFYPLQWSFCYQCQYYALTSDPKNTQLATLLANQSIHGEFQDEGCKTKVAREDILPLQLRAGQHKKDQALREMLEILHR